MQRLVSLVRREDGIWSILFMELRAANPYGTFPKAEETAPLDQQLWAPAPQLSTLVQMQPTSWAWVLHF